MGKDAMSNEAQRLFDEGLYCAESVLLAIARRLGIDSPLIPGIATGLCSGMGRSANTCGALSGAVLGLGLTTGRSDPAQPVSENYALVKQLVRDFEKRFGSSNCAELLGCHLATSDGQQKFRAENLGTTNCRVYTGAAFEMAVGLIE